MFRVKYVGFEMDGHPEFTVYAVQPSAVGDDVEFLIYTECWAYWSADDFEPIDPFNGCDRSIELTEEDSDLFDAGMWLANSDMDLPKDTDMNILQLTYYFVTV